MAKTLTQLLTSTRRSLSEKRGLRYKTGTTTSAGNAGGTTFIDSGLNVYLDSHFVGCVARLTNGNAAGHKQPLISTFTSSTGTVTVAESLGLQVGSSVTYEIMERGIWDDAQLIEYLINAQDEVLDLLTDSAMPLVLSRTTISGTAGTATLPSDLIRLISLQSVDNDTIALLHPDERAKFNKDSFLSTTSNAKMVGIVTNGELHYRPTNNLTIYVDYVPRVAEVSSSQSTEFNDHLSDLLVLGACARAFLVSEDFTNFKAFDDMKMRRITALNSQGQKRYNLER